MVDMRTVEDFVALVEAGAFVAAMERYYADHASMQENDGEPRRGLKTLIAGEEGFLAQNDSVVGKRLSAIMTGGDEVAIVWRWTITKGGVARSFEEVSWQIWQDGKIVQERFFYDPAQMRP